MDIGSKGRGISVDSACETSGDFRRGGVRAGGGKVPIRDANKDLTKNGTD